MKNEQSPELLTVEQFAQRLQVSRATVFTWIQKQILVQGRHFIKIGRVLRFTWSDDFIFILLQESAAAVTVAPPTLSPAVVSHKKTGSSLNWEY
ncbi:MAG: helix-turn-helix domain-containing protein [Chlorobiales bacterium]|nr:helix-turn-helix domain-containing protein [Chlorobiales bacterium]